MNKGGIDSVLSSDESDSGLTSQQFNNKRKDHNMEIKVLGTGCAKCQATEKNVKEAVAETGVAANIEKVSSLLDIAKYGVFGTPAVVVDGEVKCVGKIPDKEEIKKWIAK